MRASKSKTDRELLAEAKGGDTSALSTLWSRHRRPALIAARNTTTRFDAEDIVAEAYLKIFELISAGKGPTGAFRPYLYRVVRSVAIDWLRNPESSSNPLEDDHLLTEDGPWQEGAFDREAAARAFQSLNPRWQEVLWYTEVEGLRPREVANLVGTNARNVSALASRAREELRSAWVEAHVDRKPSDQACRVTLTHLQRYQRGKLTAARSRDVEAHLAECETCTSAAAEYSALNRNLALVLTTIFVGGTSASSLLAALGRGAAETTVALAPTAFATAGQSSGSSASRLGAATGAANQVALIAAAGIVAVAAIGGTVFALSSGAPTSIEAVSEGSSAGPESESVDIVRDVQDGSTDNELTTSRETGTESSRITTPTVPTGAAERELTEERRTPDRKPETPGAGGPGTGNPGPGETEDENETPDPEEEVDSKLDPSLAIGFECYFISSQGLHLTGTSSEYGVFKARITQPPSSVPVPLIAFPTITDAYGNTFEEIFSGTDPAPDPWWWTPALTPLEQWPGLSPGNIEEVLVEMQFLTPDGRYSPWTAVELDSSC